MIVVVVVVGLLRAAAADDVSSGVSYWEFPPLFQLDDYEVCLGRGETFCLGEFGIIDGGQTDPLLFKALQEYTEYPRHFNRTRVHRGVCVTDRRLCPQDSSKNNTFTALDPVTKFQQCVTDREVTLNRIDVTLEKLIYCRSRDPDAPQMDDFFEPSWNGYHYAFTIVMVLLVALNVVGTIADVSSDEKSKHNSVLLCWSIPRSWRRLVMDYAENGDPRLSALTPIQGVRVVILFGVIVAHCAYIHYMIFLQSPDFMEDVLDHPVTMLLNNGPMIVQMFVMLSSFLLAYNLLVSHSKKPIKMDAIPKGIINRIARISPLYLVVLMFASSWWSSLRSGPLWSPTVVAETRNCYNKFWIHALYLNNIVQPGNECLVQTWFLAVDFQLYIVSVILTVLLINYRRVAIGLFAFLFIFFGALNSGLAYMFHWIPALYLAKPEWIRVLFTGVPSFTYNYTATWSSAPATFMGLLLAFLHYELQEIGFKPKERKWLVYGTRLSIPLILWWMILGYWIRDMPVSPGLYAGLDRAVLALFMAMIIYGLINGLDDTLTSIFGAKMWHSLGRMSLGVLLGHWILNLTLVGARPVLTHSSVVDIGAEVFAITMASYTLAVPLTIFIETPMLLTLKRLA